MSFLSTNYFKGMPMTRDYIPNRVFVMTDRDTDIVINEPACGFIVYFIKKTTKKTIAQMTNIYLKISKIH